MIKDRSQKTRILIASKGKIKRVCNILSLHNNKGELYEYKVTFPGFGESKLEYIKSACLNSINGFTKSTIDKKISGNIEVSYHSNGKISFKDISDEGKHYSKKTKSFEEILDYSHFMRFNIKSINLLKDFDKEIEKSCKPFTINKLDDKQFAIDFYLTRKKIKFKLPHFFKSNYQFIMEDSDNRFFLLLHFFEFKDIKFDEFDKYVQIIGDNITN